jgi:acyl-coenzyme A thioesterase PaaI-like protein
MGAAMTDPAQRSLQERYTPGLACFGCGPANERGLGLRSFERGDELWAEWRPERHHEAFPGILSGGIICALLDCHSTWAAMHHLMRASGADRPPATVTSDLAVKMLRPTPTDAPIELTARVVEAAGPRAVVEATLAAGGRPCATSRGSFVAVRPGHPAHRSW